VAVFLFGGIDDRVFAAWGDGPMVEEFRGRPGLQRVATSAWPSVGDDGAGFSGLF
jgi:hypothetical protein